MELWYCRNGNDDSNNLLSKKIKKMKETDLERKKLERGQKFFYGFLGIIFLIVSGTLITGHFQRQYLKNNPRISKGLFNLI